MTANNNGNKINFICRGDGPPVILIHGIAASACDWTEMIPELTSKGYCAYAPDLPGHGESIKPEDPGEYHVESIYQQFSQWLDELNLETPPIMVGHSLGGYLSMLHAIREPNHVRGLILIDPFYSPNQLSPFLRLVRQRPGLGEKTMRIIPKWLIHTVIGWDPTISNQFSPQARQQIAMDYKRTSPQFVYITKDIPDLTPSLAKISQPTLVLWGDNDQTLNPNTFPPLVEKLPNAHSNTIAESGHQPHIGYPNLTNHLTLNFIDTKIEGNPVHP
jgi:pimeloyl-ACP methyl ester carboxylesterase